MEVLSGTSRVVALVSLAIQLGDDIKKLCDFWQSMNGASKDIQLIIGDLSILADIAESIGEEAKAPRPHTRSLDTSLKALNQCRSGVEELRNIIYKYQPGVASPNPKVLAWTACKFTWQGENVRRFKEALRDTKLTLMLARQESNNWATSLHNEAHDQALAMIAQVGAKQVRFQNSITGIETTLHSLLLVRSTTPSTSPSATPTDINNHMNMLRKKIADATSMIRNPLLRSALQEKLESALPYLATDLTRYSNLETTTNAQLPGEPCVIKSTMGLKKGTFKLIESTLIRSIFGSLHFITTTFKTTESSYHNELGFDDKYEIQTTLILHPSQWLLACGLRIGLCMSVGMSSSGLNCSLKSYRAVPDDAAIFDSCRIGDINTVRQLFDHGLASPWDTSSRGLTPLFMAARYANVDLCKMLIEQGADVHAVSWSGETLASWACLQAPENKVPKINPTESCVDHINTIRLFWDSLEICDHVNCSGLLGLRRLISTPCSLRISAHPPSFPAAFKWILPLLQPYIDVFVPAVGRTFAKLLFEAMAYSDTKPLEQLISAVPTINTINITKWFSPAHFIASRLANEQYRDSTQYLVTHGLDLHVAANEQYFKTFEYPAIRGQTPMTIAMRYSTSFSKYISLLRICNENIPSFVVKELEGDYLRQAGWKQDSLQALFDLEFEPLPMPKVVCRDAGHCLDPKVWSFGREVCWETFLAQLREGGTSLIDPSSLLRDIRQSVLGSKAPPPEVCYSCQLRGRYEEDVMDESGDSPFLFPADAFF